MRRQVEVLVQRVQRIAAVHGLTLVADLDIADEVVDDEVENGDGEKTEAVSPGNEDRSDRNQDDARRAVEVLLDVHLRVTASGAAGDRRARRRRNDIIRLAAVLTRLGNRRAGFADQSPVALAAE